ncbi:hypothetical protein QE152_g29462 [Popillia japonica]|uniref:Uncharacterized protein n=1 Tax=Popillia japonica TaxID=7064 RepID=A0AAW1JGW8_POPJA
MQTLFDLLQPNIAKVEAKTALNEIKILAYVEITTQANVYQTVSCATDGQLPSIPFITRSIQRTRQRNEAVPSMPTTWMDLVIPEEYKMGKLRFESGSEEQRIVIISTDIAKVEAKTALNEIKILAYVEITTQANVYQTVSCATDGQLPSIPFITRSIQRTRQRNEAVPSMPTTWMDLVIPEEYKMGKLRFESGSEEQRIVIISTGTNLEYLYATL